MYTNSNYFDFGKCPECEEKLGFISYEEEEYYKDGITPTGRKRTSIDYIVCNNCGHKETVDCIPLTSWK